LVGPEGFEPSTNGLRVYRVASENHPVSDGQCSATDTNRWSAERALAWVSPLLRNTFSWDRCSRSPCAVQPTDRDAGRWREFEHAIRALSECGAAAMVAAGSFTRHLGASIELLRAKTCGGADKRERRWSRSGSELDRMRGEATNVSFAAVNLGARTTTTGRGCVKTSRSAGRVGQGFASNSASALNSSKASANMKRVRAYCELGSCRNGQLRAMDSMMQALAARRLRAMTDGACSGKPLM